ncbi:MAG: fumarylacetoacetate hydrolase family protein, partial [Acidimicrobiales bacterium]
AVLGRRHVPWDTGAAIACGGVLVQPGDLLVGDADGVVVVPAHLLPEVVSAAVEQERQERFVAERVAAGEAIPGLFPMGPDWRGAYDAWCATGEGR